MNEEDYSNNEEIEKTDDTVCPRCGLRSYDDVCQACGTPIIDKKDEEEEELDWREKHR